MDNGYRVALKDEESLAIFLRCVKRFDQHFCDAMASGEDFTLRLEIHGNKGQLIHCRVNRDGFERPRDVAPIDTTHFFRRKTMR